MITLGSPVAPALDFTGPVDMVNGENDFIFCSSDCTMPVDQSKLVLEILYPARSKASESVIIPGLGHGINVHYRASLALKQMLDFVRRTGP